MISTSASKIDALIYDAVFGTDAQKEQSRKTIHELALSQGIFPASIQTLYDAAGKGLYKGITVPAINIRGITYAVARAVFRAAMKNHVGPFTFEIARSEIGYTEQKPGEYSTCILAAAINEGYRGPVFIQGDHYQVNAKKYSTEPDKEINAIKELIRDSISAGFYNIDIDASTIVELNKTDLDLEQEKNCRVTADLTKFIRSIQPAGVTVSVGAEIGEVGGRNSTTDDLEAFMRGYLKMIGPQVKGISKISVQTGTTHGGVVLPDGKIAQVEVDFKTLEKLSKLAREKYGPKRVRLRFIWPPGSRTLFLTARRSLRCC
jgi:fructose/tagatose bisphosphate aldolase